jgi:putative glutamine amidotransferase
MSSESTKPIVVVTGPHKKLRFGWWATRLMLWIQGLEGHYITPQRTVIPQNVKGVIIGGGDDIEPEHYGLTGDAGAKYDAARDALELRIIKQAIASKLPLLGICRGAQLMNVALGGNLHQDLRPLRKLTPNRNSIFPIKHALLEPSSKIAKIMGTDRVKVNSLHNQAINHTGDTLELAATDEDRFTQAVENPEEDFLIGVQWHPEYMPYSRHQRLLFNAFSKAVERSENTLILLDDKPSS